MKKIITTIFLGISSIMLVACNNDEKPKTTATNTGGIFGNNNDESAKVGQIHSEADKAAMMLKNKAGSQ